MEAHTCFPVGVGMTPQERATASIKASPRSPAAVVDVCRRTGIAECPSRTQTQASPFSWRTSTEKEVRA